MSGCGGFDNHDAETEVGETPLVVTNQVLTVDAIKVLSADFAVSNAVPKHVVGGDQDRMGDRHDGLLVPTPLGEAAILRGEAAVALASGAASAFHEGRAKPAVALRRPCVAALARTFVIARTDRRPTQRWMRQSSPAARVKVLQPRICATPPWLAARSK